MSKLARKIALMRSKWVEWHDGNDPPMDTPQGRAWIAAWTACHDLYGRYEDLHEDLEREGEVAMKRMKLKGV